MMQWCSGTERGACHFFPHHVGLFLGFCSGVFCPLVFPLVAYFALVFRFVALVLLVNYRADCAQCLRAWESTPHKQSSPLNYPLSPTIQTYPLILAEWRRQHLSPSHPVGTPPPPHSTDCPMTRCKPTPGLAPFLHSKALQSHSQQVTRARLLLGRSRTGAVLHRFAKTTDSALFDPHCPHCSTADPPSAGRHRPCLA